MPQDHYVAQTYVRKWCDLGNRDHMHAFRKSDGKRFPAHPHTVCREKNGDRITGWIDDEFALGKFRAMFEPRWDEAVKAAGEGRLSDDNRLTIAGAGRATLERAARMIRFAGFLRVERLEGEIEIMFD